MRELARRHGVPLAVAIVVASLGWVLLLIVLPQFLMIDFSLRPNLPPSRIGGPDDVYTVRNYVTLWNNTIHLAIFLKTIWASALVTACTLFVCYPIAFVLAQVARPRTLPLLMLLLLIPFWIN